MMKRIALVGCGKSKTKPEGPSKFIEARDLYTGMLFRKRRAFVESRGLDWWILSAWYGVTKPTTSVMWYEKSLATVGHIELAEWHLYTAAACVSLWSEIEDPPKLSEVTIEIHAGKAYCEPLATLLRTMGIAVVTPVAGLGIGQQLAWYDQQLKAVPS
jgi:hypothetical protein